jgi:acetolactate synthase-1/2/3 large subunit
LAGHLIIECLIAQGVETVFGVPGESYLAVLDGFHAHREQIRFVANRHESGAAFMAEAHGKLTRRPGVCMVTRGPGACNASIGLHTAFQDSTPMVLFVGDVAQDARDREAFQEVDFFSALKPYAKRVERIDRADRIPEYISRAFACAQSGRMGPVVLILPEDMLTQEVDSSVSPWLAVPLSAVTPDIPSLQPLVQMLKQAERPLMILGGSGWTAAAAKAITSCSERFAVPVVNAFRFQDSFDNHHPHYAGDMGLGINPALRDRILSADVLLVIGARLGEATTSGYTVPKLGKSSTQTIIHIHPDAEELGRVYPVDFSLCVGNEEFSVALQNSLSEHPFPISPARQSWTQSSHADYLRYIGMLDNADAGNVSTSSNERVPLDMSRVVQELQRQLPPDAVLSNGAGNFAAWLHRYFRYHGQAKGYKTQLAPTNGAMGYGVPAGIAANLLTGRLSVTFTGDGDFLMCGQELATASQYGAASIIILLNNGMYGTIRMHQEREYPTRSEAAGTHLRNPDFVALAQSYDYRAQRIQRTEEFAPVLQAAIAAAKTESCGTLIEIMITPDYISPRATLQEIQTQALARLR